MKTLHVMKTSGFWESGDHRKVPENHSLASSHQGENLLKEAILSQCEADAVRTLDRGKQVLSAINSTNVTPPLAARNSNHLLESAREILAIDDYRKSSSCKATQPLSPVNSTFAEQKEVADEKTRVSLRLRRRGKVASEITLADVHEKKCAAEERKLKELEHIRDQLESRIERKKQETVKRKVKQQQRSESKKNRKSCEKSVRGWSKTQ